MTQQFMFFKKYCCRRRRRHRRRLIVLLITTCIGLVSLSQWMLLSFSSSTSTSTSTSISTLSVSSVDDPLSSSSKKSAFTVSQIPSESIILNNDQKNQQVVDVLSSSLSSLSLGLESYNPARFPVLSLLAPNTTTTTTTTTTNNNNIIHIQQQQEQQQQQQVIPVGIVTIDPLIGEARHYLYDGIIGSKYLSLVGIVSLYGGKNNTHPHVPFQPSDAQVWLVDGARVSKLKRDFLSQLLSKSTSTSKSSSSTSSTSAPHVVFLDWSDRFQFQLRNYHKLNIFREDDNDYNNNNDNNDNNDNNANNDNNNDNNNNVRLAVRSIIQGRYFDTTNQSIVLGRIAPNLPTRGGPMLHCPYAVRSDIVDMIYQLIILNNNYYDDNDNTTTSTSSNNNTSAATTTTDNNIIESTTTTLQPNNNDLSALQHSIFDTPHYHHQRPIDVVHMWEISFKEGKSKLRNAVSKLVRGLNGTTIMYDDKNDSYIHHHPSHQQPFSSSSSSSNILLQTSISEYGERRKVGRNTVNPMYVQQMLQSKIVIVTQKDDWEDHYRLLEAIVCGPLVIADRMIAPPKGLIHNETIIFFDTLDELQSLILYYLSPNPNNQQERKRIAQNGWNVAMTQHRSWHRMEEIIFGRPLTT